MENPTERQDELQPEQILIVVDGEERWVNAYILGNAAQKIGKTYRGLRIIINNREKAGHPIQLYKRQVGKGTYILEEDLKNLMRAVPIE